MSDERKRRRLLAEPKVKLLSALGLLPTPFSQALIRSNGPLTLSLSSSRGEGIVAAGFRNRQVRVLATDEPASRSGVSAERRRSKTASIAALYRDAATPSFAAGRRAQSPVDSPAAARGEGLGEESP